MSSKEIFWTDLTQAVERLQGSVVMYDGLPVYVHTVLDGSDWDDGCHRATTISCGPKKEEARKKLNSPKFKRFRELPKLGWMNAKIGAVYMDRRAATTRTHGLKNDNTQVSTFRNMDQEGNPYIRKGGDYTYTHFIYEQGYLDMQNEKFPSLEATLDNIVQKSSIAINLKYCVMRDARGIRWLYRNLECVGLFTGTDTLNLLSRHAYLREEIMDDRTFTIRTIREF